jgi:RNA polymerase sigma-70 factor (ECF subfamily)
MSTVKVTGRTSGRLEPEFDRIFREHYQLVFRTAYGVTGSPEDAEDIVQTIFLRMLRRQFPPDCMRDPRAYLYRAAVNLSLNTMRVRQRHVLTDDAERLESIVNRVRSSDEQLHERLYAAIAELEPEDSEILILRYVHEYDNQKIAQLLGKSRGAVAVRLFRSRVRLKQLIRASHTEKKS